MVAFRYLGMLLGIFFLAACAQPGQPKEEPAPLRILCAKWAASDYLQKLSENFTRETGVKVVVEQVPWDDFYSVFFNNAPKYDMVGGDSQWLGIGATKGYYTDLTSWIRKSGVDKTMTEASIIGYSEYPKGSGRYWAVPLMGDAMGFAYRKDLFEDEAEKKAFREKNGYELAVPKTWQELLDIAEFFYRPSKDLYGVNVWASREYDGTTMGVQSLIWASGADLGDEKTFKVRGVLNVQESAKALEMYKTLHDLGAPEWSTAYLETNKAFESGKVAMVMSYFAFFPELNDPQQNPYAAVTGFFANPSGAKRRVSSLGGQGLSIISTSAHKENALKFLSWFSREDVQKEWARLGGYSCNRSVLSSKEFLSATPYNAALTESMQMMKDFWTVPEYLELLKVSQKYWWEYLFSQGTLTASEAMDAVAREWEAIFEAAGYYKE